MLTIEAIAASLAEGSVVIAGKSYPMRALSSREFDGLTVLIPAPLPPRVPGPNDAQGNPTTREDDRDEGFLSRSIERNARVNAAMVGVALGLEGATGKPLDILAAMKAPSGKDDAAAYADRVRDKLPKNLISDLLLRHAQLSRGVTAEAAAGKSSTSSPAESPAPPSR